MYWFSDSWVQKLIFIVLIIYFEVSKKKKIFSEPKFFQIVKKMKQLKN